MVEYLVTLATNMIPIASAQTQRGTALAIVTIVSLVVTPPPKWSYYIDYIEHPPASEHGGTSMRVFHAMEPMAGKVRPDVGLTFPSASRAA